MTRGARPDLNNSFWQFWNCRNLRAEGHRHSLRRHCFLSLFFLFLRSLSPFRLTFLIGGEKKKEKLYIRSLLLLTTVALSLSPQARLVIVVFFFLLARVLVKLLLGNMPVTERASDTFGLTNGWLWRRGQKRNSFSSTTDKGCANLPPLGKG